MPKLQADQTQTGIVPCWHFKILELFLPHYVLDVLYTMSALPHCQTNEFTKKQNHTDVHPLSFLSKLEANQGYRGEQSPYTASPFKGSLLTQTAFSLHCWPGRNRTGSFPGLPPPSSYYPLQKGKSVLNALACQPPIKAFCQQKSSQRWNFPGP